MYNEILDKAKKFTLPKIQKTKEYKSGFASVPEAKYEQYRPYFTTIEEFERWNKNPNFGGNSCRKTKRGIWKEVWFGTVEAKEHFNEIIKPGMKVLELGLGGSTIVFAEKDVELLIAIDNEIEWVNRIESYLRVFYKEKVDNKLYNVFLADSDQVYDFIDTFPDNFFDLILIDIFAQRYTCMERSVRILKPGGIMILDDVQDKRWYLKESIKKFDTKYSNQIKKFTSPGIKEHTWFYTKLKENVINTRKTKRIG